MRPAAKASTTFFGVLLSELRDYHTAWRFGLAKATALLEQIKGVCRCRVESRDCTATVPHLLQVQEGLVQATWVARVLQHPACKPSMSPADGSLLFSGPRLKMGVAFGEPEGGIRPDAVTARASYCGPVVSR